MVNLVKKYLKLFVVSVFFLLRATISSAITIDFEALQDNINVDNFYSSVGVFFVNTISLTSGLSLNEIDYPPSSGIIAIGDYEGPIEIIFDNPASNIFANFTYGYKLTFSAFDLSNNSLGTYFSNNDYNLGYSEVIYLPFNNISKLIISGEINNYFIMDDLNYTTQSQPVPEPTTSLLFLSGLILFISTRRNKLINC